MSRLVVKGVTVSHLLFTQCPNAHTHIFGFYHQTEEINHVDEKSMRVTLRDTCRDCGCEVSWSHELAWDHSGFMAGAGI